MVKLFMHLRCVQVRFIMKDAIRKQLESGNIVLLSHLGRVVRVMRVMKCRMLCCMW